MSLKKGVYTVLICVAFAYVVFWCGYAIHAVVAALNVARRLPRGLTRMPDLQEAFTKLANSIIRSERQGHAAMVMRITSILEYDLERSIKWEFRSLNNR
jgi:hypothetical protein